MAMSLKLSLALTAIVFACTLSVSNGQTTAKTASFSASIDHNPVSGSKTKLASFTLEELKSGKRVDELKEALTSTGILTVPMSSDIAKNARSEALEGLCDCILEERSGSVTSSFLTIEGTDQQWLLKASEATTLRTTLATATSGDTPLPLPKQQLDRVCKTHALADSMENLRDEVALVTQVFVQTLDDYILETTMDFSPYPPVLRDLYGSSYPTIASVDQAANHLEHFHLYQEKEQSKVSNDENTNMSPDTIPWHSDAGLFLAFVPAHNCQEDEHEESDDSFWVLSPSGEAMQIEFDPNSVVLMLGAGAEHWLNLGQAAQEQNNKVPRVALKATRHAVQLQPGQTRAWYGMMHLVPDSAILRTNPDRTFADMKRSMSLNENHHGEHESHHGHAKMARTYSDNKNDASSAVSIGCGHDDLIAENEDEMSLFGTTPVVVAQRRRRLQHVQNPQACNNVTNFFCWMQCVDIPSADQIDGYLSEGYSLYCLDPAILASSGNRVSQAVKPCSGGRVHNPKCQGSWQPTAPGAAAYDLGRNRTSDSSYDPDAFCYGGTSVYMDGFHWSDTVCIIYLFPEWILTSRGKVALASLGTLILGMSLEIVLFYRRKSIATMAPGYTRLAASGLVYGLQLTLGYMLMLVVMTYSGPLFMTVVLGLVFGHVFFNSRDAIFNGTTQVTKTAASTPNSSEDLMETAPTNSSSPSNSKADEEVPEGLTPCCQNEL